MAAAFAAPCIPQVNRATNLRRARHASAKRTLRPTPTCTGHLSRRAFLQAGALSVIIPGTGTAIADTMDAKVTDRVYLDVKIAGLPRGRITVGLFGQDAPESVATFKTVADGALRGRGGRSAGYRYSVGSKVVRGRFVELGRVMQIDALNQSPGTPQRQPRLVEPPENRDSNTLKHFPGAVSMRRGGGKFEFDIALAPDAGLDESNIVIGRVVGGEDVVQMLANVPTTQKTSRDGFRNVGKVIGDARAKVDLEDKPLQKIQIYECGVLSAKLFHVPSIGNVNCDVDYTREGRPEKLHRWQIGGLH